MHTSKIRSFLRTTTIFNLYYHRNERTYIHVYEPYSIFIPRPILKRERNASRRIERKKKKKEKD